MRNSRGSFKLKKFSVRYMFMFAILGVLSFGLVLSGCGTGSGPYFKVAITDNGEFAIDFDVISAELLALILDNPTLGLDPEVLPNFLSLGKSVESLEDSEFTIEAWVNVSDNKWNEARSRSDFVASIFSRASDQNGIILAHDSGGGFPKRYRITMKHSDQHDPDWVPNSGPNYLAVSDVFAEEDVWVHVAGVLTTEDQGTGPGKCVDDGIFVDGDTNPIKIGDEDPHLAIYINGVLNNCGTTDEKYSEALTDMFEFPGITSPEFPFNEWIGRAHIAGGSLGQWTSLGELDPTDRFTGVIDEVRFWTVARSQTELQACMGQELEITGGICGIDNNILKGYWKFNEGTGMETVDYSGSGNTGTKLTCSGVNEFGLAKACDSGGALEIDWSNGWTPGYPF